MIVKTIRNIEKDGASRTNAGADIMFMDIIWMSRVTKSENFPDSKIFVTKTFRIKRVNRVNFKVRDKCALKVVLQDFG